MKTFYFTTAMAAALMLAAGCKSNSSAPAYASNPWQDDYSQLAAMENYRQWGTYNVHDPACRKFGDWFYMYSTDAIFAENRREAREKGVPLGFVQVRRSKDLVHWEFVGWAFNEIPPEAVEWVRTNNDGRGATNIWAPYVIRYGDVYRLYYCVSAFGKKISYLGLAEAPMPEGPWTLKGAVVKTNDASIMNAIDPTIIEDPKTGRQLMIYGSYFGGLFSVELNPVTGLPFREGDQGKVVARRANYQKDNLEAPEIIYHPVFDKYYLFVSYDPLMTTYNVRVGRSDSPDGPFLDFDGQDLRDTTNNFPILTAAYRFDNHPGWAGVGHCGVVEDQGRYFMMHQGRLAPYNMMMDLHVREVFFTPDGWAVVSPERYAGTPQKSLKAKDLKGEWEIIRIREPHYDRRLEAGQILPGQGMQPEEFNLSQHYRLDSCVWSFDAAKQLLSIELDGEKIKDLRVFCGHDWENRRDCILFTGLDATGRSVWGKKL
jgi:arabinan endo-1,5-alpha-L-arabinosidase